MNMQTHRAIGDPICFIWFKEVEVNTVIKMQDKIAINFNIPVPMKTY